MLNLKLTKKDIAYLRLLIDMVTHEDKVKTENRPNYPNKTKKFKLFLYDDSPVFYMRRNQKKTKF